MFSIAPSRNQSLLIYFWYAVIYYNYYNAFSANASLKGILLCDS